MIKHGLPLDIYYEEMDWPSVPDDLCKELVEYAMSAENIWEGKTQTKFSDISQPYENFEQFAAPEKLVQWVRDNLPKELIEEKYIIRLQGIREGKSVAKHKDGLRRSSFNFVLTDNSGITNWFSEDGTLLETVNYKTKVWYHHQSQVIHDVVQINVPRIAVTLYKFEFQPWLIKESKMYP